ncbi:arylsulfatase B-like [Ostrinia nubilalis]|uniref:arylsulfatase B-like n=1 Tax=Ostrinia nubilalis TaxID=29057 RepID=UPI00308257B2
MLFWNCFFILFIVAKAQFLKPNIVFIVADDLGWDDVSFHGSDQILTPNLDTMAYQGCPLQQYYTDVEGTPSRSALFTGKYAMRLGTQGISIKPSEDRGIPPTERLLPDYLKELGYATHLIGKWGVGKSRAHYLPSNRGFDTFYGFLGDAVDYFTYNAIDKSDKATFYGLDLFDDMDPVEDESRHLTNILTEKAVQVIREHNTSTPLYLHISHAAPHIGGALTDLQPPLDSLKDNEYIAHPLRRLYAGLVTSLDKSIGNIIAALAEREILQNTLVIFVSDNGAPTIGWSQNYGSNFPFRGAKSTPWEGGVRSVGVVWHASIPARRYNNLFHVTDWLPTLVSAAGGTVTNKIDGVNQWKNLINDDATPPRQEVLISIDELRGWAALREGDFKIVVGDFSQTLNRYYGMDLKQVKHARMTPFYEDVLIDSETGHVFKETLNLILDVDLAEIKRSDLNLTQLYQGVHRDICIPSKAKGCLYNITADPLETQDLWDDSPDIVRRLSLRLRSFWSDLKPRSPPLSDLRADPSARGFVWLPWLENNSSSVTSTPSRPSFPLKVTSGEVKYLINININDLRTKVNSYINRMGGAIIDSVENLFSLS